MSSSQPFRQRSNEVTSWKQSMLQKTVRIHSIARRIYLQDSLNIFMWVCVKIRDPQIIYHFFIRTTAINPWMTGVPNFQRLDFNMVQFDSIPWVWCLRVVKPLPPRNHMGRDNKNMRTTKWQNPISQEHVDFETSCDCPVRRYHLHGPCYERTGSYLKDPRGMKTEVLLSEDSCKWDPWA